ncbi:MAG: LysE/ArgO family amino acid transporter [Pseudomonadota bacterium]
MMSAATTGFLSGFALILAIGAQNAFVLRQGLLRQHVFPLCLLCAASDAILITAGVAGFGALVAAFPRFPTVMMIAGAAFLIVYGFTRFRAAARGDYAMTLDGQGLPLWPTLGIAAAFTWLNPHVYLDTLGLMGALSTQFETQPGRIAFGAGGVLASFVFFFSLGYGARLLAPIMQSARAWRRLDVLIGIVMWALAAKLIWPL